MPNLRYALLCQHLESPPPPFTREHLRAQSDLQRDSLPDVSQNVADKAYDEMLAAVDDIESLVQGYSYYFLEGELKFLKGNTIAIPPDQLMRIMQSLTGILSMGPLSRHPAHSTYLRLTHKLWASYGHTLGLSD